MRGVALVVVAASVAGLLPASAESVAHACQVGAADVERDGFYVAPLATHVTCLGPDAQGSYLCRFTFSANVTFTGGIQCRVDGVVLFTCEVVDSTSSPCRSPLIAGPFHQVEFVTLDPVFRLAEGGAGEWRGEIGAA
ncbi:MAG: hypothetical protein ACYDCK_11755 [Thermoplasmatota archaeon]